MDRVTVTVDGAGRIALPKDVMERLGIHPEERVSVELVEGAAIIRAQTDTDALTERIAAMNLPVADWAQMKKEIAAGRLGLTHGQ